MIKYAQYLTQLGVKGFDISSSHNRRWKWMAVNHYNFPTKLVTGNQNTNYAFA